MVSFFRLKGRGYIMGNVFLVSLFTLTSAALLFCLNFLPEVISQLLFSKVSEVQRSLIVAVCCLLLIFSAFLIYSSARYGSDRFFLRKAQNQGASVKDFFCYFHPKRAFSAFFFELRFLTLKLAAALFCLSPAILCFLMLLNLWKSTASVKVSVILLFSFVAFLINGIIFTSKIYSSLFLARYYYIEGKFVSFSHIISSSQSAMKEHKHTLRQLKLSFLGWFFLCLLIFPLGYVYSYYNQTLGVAANEFMNK